MPWKRGGINLKKPLSRLLHKVKTMSKTGTVVLLVIAAYVSIVLGFGWFTSSWLVGLGVAVVTAAALYAVHWMVKKYKGPLVVVFGG